MIKFRILSGSVKKLISHQKITRNIFCTPFLLEAKKETRILSRYEPFRDDRSPVILDVEEERRKTRIEVEEELEEIADDFRGIDPERGVHGVIDVKELVEILRRDNAQDIFVAEIPAKYSYVQHMVIVSGKSVKHMVGMAEFVRRVFKYKMNQTDKIPVIEGKNSREWIALDLGNIVLHIFSPLKREKYDLETLWTVGCELDKLAHEPDDPVIQMLKQNTIYKET